MNTEKPLVDKQYLLEKYQGTGGWTYAAIPEIPQDRKAHFGWVRVRGWIDNYELKQYHLMPMGNGTLFLAVKSAIRKKIGKQAGDQVHIVLYPDHSEFQITDELKACFDLEAGEIYENFQSLSESNKKAYTEWIDSAGTIDTKAKRIAIMMNKLQYGKGLFEQ